MKNIRFETIDDFKSDPRRILRATAQGHLVDKDCAKRSVTRLFADGYTISGASSAFKVLGSLSHGVLPSLELRDAALVEIGG